MNAIRAIYVAALHGDPLSVAFAVLITLIVVMVVCVVAAFVFGL